MPERSASGSVGAPLTNLRALPGNGLRPIGLGRWVPSIYSVSHLNPLGFALGSNGLLALIAMGSFLARNPSQNPRTVRGLEL